MNVLYYIRKITEVTTVDILVMFFRALVPIFSSILAVFVGVDAKIFFVSGRWYPIVTPLVRLLG